ncbi:MAG TPA: class I SAM-dependent methyltransferase [Ruminiclostridium sp.]|nr:class I SAM-dependent methyltransferase [Ruminiclostridium sp.]
MLCPVCNKALENNAKSIEEHKINFEKKEMIYSIFKCSNCGSEFADPLLPPPDSWYINMDEYYGWRWEFGKASEDITKNAPKGDILEIGCGQGIFIEKLKEQHNVYGIDVNTTSIEIAQKKGLKAFACKLEDIAGLDIPCEFDTIAFFNLLEHIHNPKEFMTSVNKLVKTGGLIILSVPNIERASRKIWKEIWDMPPHHLVRYSCNGLKSLMEEAGFDIIKTEAEPKNNILQVIFFIEELVIKTVNPLNISNKKLRRTLKTILRLVYLLPSLIYHSVKCAVCAKELKGKEGMTLYILARKK